MTKKIGALMILLASLSLGNAGQDKELLTSATNWRFFGGSEFPPGASGTFSLTQEGEQPVALLEFDYTDGGVYVTGVGDIKVNGVKELRFKVKSEEAVPVGVRLIDNSAQAHQSLFTYTNVGEWQEFRINLEEPAGLIFGGANDKVLHFPLTQIRLFTQKKDGVNQGKVLFKEVQFH